MHFAGATGWIAVSGAEPLFERLALLAPDWPRAERGVSTPASRIHASMTGGLWRFETEGEWSADQVFLGDGPASFGLLGALQGTFVMQDAGLACLHAAAVDSAAGLLVLVGDSNAGKSTLSVALTALGRQYAGDDRLVIRLGGRPEGVSQALSPKLRLPLPPDAPRQFRSFVDERTAGRDEAMALALLRLRPGEMLSFGEARPLAALVLLDRRDSGEDPPDLVETSRPEVLDALLEGGFAPRLKAAERLKAFHGLSALPRYRLGFASSFAAARLLSDRFP
ncbi:MAG TPA: hypothetical protein VEU47_08735 [Candidatus Cybelea sp.]|nr:hypothetical protein [Candidatus Cybelea sp.]